MKQLSQVERDQVAEACIRELSAVLIKHGCILVHRFDTMVLAIDSGNPQVASQSVAQIAELLAKRAVWRRVVPE